MFEREHCAEPFKASRGAVDQVLFEAKVGLHVISATHIVFKKSDLGHMGPKEIT